MKLNRERKNIVQKVFLSVVLFVALTMPNTTMAQNSREYIRKKISQKGQCRNVAITNFGGSVMLYGKNGYAYKDISPLLASKIKNLATERKYIDDIQLTNTGSWIILAEDVVWYDIPAGLEKQLKNFYNLGEKITAVTLNDYGEWIVVGTKEIAASSYKYINWLKDGISSYGNLRTVHMTDDAIVAVFERGFKYGGETPQSLIKAIKEADFEVYKVKFVGKSWFIASKNGKCKYYM